MVRFGLDLIGTILGHGDIGEQERSKGRLPFLSVMVGHGGETEYVPDAKITWGDGRK